VLPFDYDVQYIPQFCPLDSIKYREIYLVFAAYSNKMICLYVVAINSIVAYHYSRSMTWIYHFRVDIEYFL
jgi:hypothetical protein